jgi:hypothetical protein
VTLQSNAVYRERRSNILFLSTNIMHMDYKEIDDVRYYDVSPNREPEISDTNLAIICVLTIIIAVLMLVGLQLFN